MYFFIELNNMNNFFSDPLTIVAAVVGVISLVLVFLLLEYYRKSRDTQFVNEVLKTKEKKDEITESVVKETNQSFTPPLQKEQPITTNIANSDIIIAQINELTNQVNAISANFKDLSEVIKSLSASTNQNTGLTEKHIEKLLSVLHNLESIVTNQSKPNTEHIADKESLAEINAKLDNILKILSAILQQ